MWRRRSALRPILAGVIVLAGLAGVFAIIVDTAGTCHPADPADYEAVCGDPESDLFANGLAFLVLGLSAAAAAVVARRPKAIRRGPATDIDPLPPPPVD